MVFEVRWLNSYGMKVLQYRWVTGSGDFSEWVNVPTVTEDHPLQQLVKIDKDGTSYIEISPTSMKAK